MTAYDMRISDWSSDVCSSDLALRRGADADGRAGDLLRDLDRDRFEHALDDDREGAGLGDGDRVLDDRARFLPALAAHAIAPQDVDRLRHQPDIAHPRDAALGPAFDRRRTPPPPLDLPRCGPGLLVQGHGLA